ENRDIERPPVVKSEVWGMQVEEYALRLPGSPKQQPPGEHAQNADPADPETIEGSTELQPATRTRCHGISPHSRIRPCISEDRKLSLGCLQWKPASAASAVGEEMMSILNWDCAKRNEGSTVG